MCRHKLLRSNFCNYYGKNCPGIYESRHLYGDSGWCGKMLLRSSKVNLIRLEKVCSFTLLLKLYNIYIQMIFSVTNCYLFISTSAACVYHM